MEPNPSLLATLQKLPLFQDLSPTQLKQLFKLCRQESYTQGDFLCKVGTDSEEMFILVSGVVEIRSSKNATLAFEKAITTVGETGLLTGAVRSASVVVKDSVTALVLNRRPLLQLMQQDSSLAIRLYRNAMLLIRQKLIAADHQIEKLLEGQV